MKQNLPHTICRDLPLIATLRASTNLILLRTELIPAFGGPAGAHRREVVNYQFIQRECSELNK